MFFSLQHRCIQREQENFISICMKLSSTIPVDRDFLSFVFQEKTNKRLLLLILGCTTLEFILFKVLYPFPSFFSDSYSYIFAAVIQSDVNVWPIGYSKFLEWLPWLTRSHISLIVFQYYLLIISGLYFYLTLTYFFRLSRICRGIVIAFLFFNPLLIYMSNYITSDPLFIGLSLIWITQLIWIVYKPSRWQLLIQGLLLFMAFTVRYNAMYYPVVAAFAFLISEHKPWAKAVGATFGVILIAIFIVHSRNDAKKLTGTAQFPILSGWQFGNNALYFREYVDVAASELPTPETVQLDSLAKDFYRSTAPKDRDLPNYVANYFIRKANAPLRRYLHLHYEATDEYANLVHWGRVSPIYGDYGRSLIWHHPGAFARHFLLVNTKNYFFPPIEQLGYYNLGLDTIWRSGQYWFQLPTSRVKVASIFLQKPILSSYPYVFCLLNLFYLATIAGLFLQNEAPMSQGFVRTTLFITLLLLLNFCFSVFANIIVIRYQIFPLLVFLSFGMVQFEQLRAGKKQLVKSRSQTLPDQPSSSLVNPNL